MKPEDKLYRLLRLEHGRDELTNEQSSERKEIIQQILDSLEIVEKIREWKNQLGQSMDVAYDDEYNKLKEILGSEG